MSLEPCVILLVITPMHMLQLFSGQILQITKNIFLAQESHQKDIKFALCNGKTMELSTSTKFLYLKIMS